MIQFINNTTDNVLKPCSREKFFNLVGCAHTKKIISQVRGGDKEAKKKLAAICIQGYNPNVSDEPKATDDCRRMGRLMQPTGLVMHDYDHLEQPKELYERFLSIAPTIGIERHCAWITASGKGLRLVTYLRPGSTIADDQVWLSEQLGAEADPAIKDVSRISYVPSKEDLLNVDDMLFEEVKVQTATEENVQTVTEANIQPATETTSVIESAANQNPERDQYLRALVDQMITDLGGFPQEGRRNPTTYKLAMSLRYVTDDNVEWIDRLIPEFGLSREEKLKTIKSAVRNPIRSDANDVLRNAEKHLKEKSTDKKNESREGAVPPAIPEKLPKLVKLLTSRVPEHIRPAVAVSVAAALATRLSNYFYKDENNRFYEPSLMCTLIAPSSSGKASIDEPIDIILEDIKAMDAEYMRREQEWMENAANQSSNKDRQKRPKTQVRVLANDITNPTFVRRLRDAENAHIDENGQLVKDNRALYSKIDEIEELYDYCGDRSSHKINTMMKKAWDRSDYGQDRSTPGSIMWKGPLRWNFNASTTPSMARGFFSKGIAEGTLSRMFHCTIIPPKQRVRFKYEEYDDAFRSELKPYLDNLDRAQGKKVCPQALLLQQRANDMIEDIMEIEGSSAWVQLAWRSAQMALKYIYVLWSANGEVWEDEFEDFFNWLFSYDMWCKFAIHGSNAKAAFGNDHFEIVSKKQSFVEMFPDGSTRDEIEEFLKKAGCKSTASNMLSQWKNRGQITVDQDGRIYRIKKVGTI